MSLSFVSTCVSYRLRQALRAPILTSWNVSSRRCLSQQQQQQQAIAATKSETSSLSNSETTAATTATENGGLPYPEGLVASRHGPGDAVICLNVGGKEFVTLRSTVNMNEVLRTHVIRAEANEEFTHQGKAVFIDRDPAQFGLILQHLRNQAAGLEATGAGGIVHSKKQKLQQALGGVSSSSSGAGAPAASSSSSKFRGTLIQIPEDTAKMRELYVEARHFQIEELEKVLCGRSLYLQLASFVSGSNSNPFQAASQVIANVRRALFATGGIGIFMGRDNIGDMWNDAVDLILGRKSLGEMLGGKSETKSSNGGEPSFA